MMTQIPSIDWIRDNGDNTLAIDWPGVDENSVVWEIGGYEGRWAYQMAEKYNPILYVFEPQGWACRKITENLKKFEKAKIYQFALWTHYGEMMLADYEHDGASLLKPYERYQRLVKIVDVFSFFLGEKINMIDVCLMNIEGGEYVLLPYMIGNGMMKSIRYFWMQWHMYMKDFGERFKAIHEMMAQTHDLYWDCGSTAQAWKLR